MSPKQRVDQQPAFVLHARPWRETSLVVELLTRDHGRVAVVAKGARRPLSALRSVLMGFQPLLADWSGSGEVKTLIRAERDGFQRLLEGRALLCGYYLNELVVHLSAREDPHPGVFEAYVAAVAALAGNPEPAPVLRRFELALLRELGYGVELEHEAGGGAPVEAGTRYAYIIERGPVRGGEGGVPVTGRTLLALGQEDFSDTRTLSEAKALLRMLINHHLGGRDLQSRRVFKELQEL
ncbi:MAG: DNA repair protein RecO [Pseudazoarcus pumilus]|nr:DNA repair protein RecO [Pseudazoarcus pumilus]